MAFEFEKLFDDQESFKTEFLPTTRTKKGQGLKVEINANLITLEYLERGKKEIEKLLGFADVYKQIEEAAAQEAAAAEEGPADDKAAPVDFEVIKQRLDLQAQTYDRMAGEIRVMARILGGNPGEDIPADRVVKSWDLTRAGRPVAVSFEELCRWDYKLLKKFYNFCVYEASEPEKKKGK